MRKSTWIASVATALVLTLGAPAAAAVNVQLNGAPLTFDVPPVVENGRTLVPMRAIFEELGARITYDAASQTVSAVHPELNRTVILVLGSTTAWVNGVETKLDVAPKAIDGRTMVPLRFISTAMGAEVGYDAATETVSIIQADPTPPVDTADEPADLDVADDFDDWDDWWFDLSDRVDPSRGDTPDSELSNAQLLSRFTRSVAYTHLDATWWCALLTDGRFEDFDYAFAFNDDEYLAESLPYLEETVTCWADYSANLLPDLVTPPGTEAAVGALNAWTKLSQNALVQLESAVEAHLGGDIEERDRLFEEGVDVLFAAYDQEEAFYDALDHVTGSDEQFLTVLEHLFAYRLYDYLGIVDSCQSELNMILHTEGEELEWAGYALACREELPEILRQQIPPSPRMATLLEDVISLTVERTEYYRALYAKLQAGPLDDDELFAELESVWDAMYEWDPAIDQLWEYLHYGEF